MSDLSSFLSTKQKAWSAAVWDGFIEAVAARLAPLEEQLNIQKEVTDAIIERGLTVIEQELAPIVAQADQILDETTESITLKLARFEEKVTGGTVICMSATSATLANGSTLNLTVVQADREFFAPTPYVALSRASTVANWALAKVNSFNRLTGILSVTLEQVTGAGGPYTDWVITSLPAATLLQKAYYEQTLALRQQVAEDKTKTGEDREASLAHRNAANESAAQSVAARNGSTQAFADMRKAIAVPLVPPAAPEIGQIWWDGNVVRVYDGVGFVPTVTASIGGLRFDEGTFAAGTDGKITIAGGFRFVMLWLNGVLLYEGRGDFTSATPDITVHSATEGDEWKYWAYQAIDATDYDTKEQVNDKISSALNIVAADLNKRLRFDLAQTLTQAEKGRALGNAGGGVLSGMRNRLINPDLNIWQRGTLFTNVGYTADRWGLWIASGGVSVTRVSAIGAKWGYSKGLAQIYYGGNGSGSPNFFQKVDDARTFAGKRVTIGVRCLDLSGKSIDLQASMIRNYGTGGGAGPAEILLEWTDLGKIPSSGGVPAYFKYSFVIPDVEGKAFGANHNVELAFRVKQNVSFTIQMSSFFFVEGDATAEDDPIAARHDQQELALCQRYFQGIQANARFISTAAGQFTHAPLNWSPMRVIPTSSIVDPGNIGNASNVSLDNLSQFGGRITLTSAAAGDCYAIARFYSLDAEL